MTGKKIPQRMCVGCREMKEKRELIRIVRTPEGETRLDATGKMSGRGAYICFSGQCLERAKKSRGLDRALNITISQEVYESLAEAMNNDCK
ncbi:MAG: YlxR family protein [Clostridiales bacterium]